LVAVAVALAATSARAAEPPAPAAPPSAPAATPATTLDAEVEHHATLGHRHLERGEAQQAVAEFRRAYELRADPRFLFDIAEAYERLGQDEQARFFYDRYLGASPDATDREDVEERLEAIDRRAARTRPLPSAPVGSFANDVVVIPVPAPAEPPRRPLWKRWWVWASVGVVVLGGVATAYALGRDGSKAPPTALGDKGFY
jgi:tetratricopeptide (TPR) repeat protein